MSRLSWIFPLFVFVVLAQPAKKPAAKPVVRLLTAGTFHKGEAEVASGPGWIGLVPVGQGFAWAKLAIRSQKVNDPILDDRPTDKTATEISVVPASKEAPLFLLRGLPQLGQNPVHTCFDRRETGNLVEQNPILLTCEAQAYSVRVSNPRKSPEVGAPSELILSHGSQRQVLYRWADGLYDQNAELRWAGDLDGDGKVDLLINHSINSNVGGLTLYLSTWAKPGELVGRVASFKAFGC
jgi:hypothetical protein